MILAIDTSCYTTSMALIDESGEIIRDSRQLLQVKPGENGLQQSAAIFQHLGNLPLLFENFTEGRLVQMIIASATPRPIKEAYLPVFKAGASFGATIARLLQVPYYTTSHQEGHIRAGLFRQTSSSEPFLAWHLSGGTTELLKVTPHTHGYQIQIIGGTSDLQVGQFIDRVGVALGTSFPAGPYLEKLAQKSDTQDALSVGIHGLNISFSGPESAAQRLIKAGTDASEIARRVFNCIGKILVRVTLEAAQKYQLKRVLFVGGVASNEIIRDILTSMMQNQDIDIIFAPQDLSGDNAVGVGLIGYDRIVKGGLI